MQVYPNTMLQPETSTSIELGVKQGLKIGPFMGYLDLAVFQQKYDNFIEFTFGQWGDPLTDASFGQALRASIQEEVKYRVLKSHLWAGPNGGPRTSILWIS